MGNLEEPSYLQKKLVRAHCSVVRSKSRFEDIVVCRANVSVDLLDRLSFQYNIQAKTNER
jgi:hypothetical protein